MLFEKMAVSFPSVSRIEAKIRILTDYLENAKDGKEAVKALKRYFKIQNDVQTAATLISIRFTLNTQDETYKKLNDKINDTLPLLDNYFKKFELALVKSKYRAELEKKFGTLLFTQIENGFKCFDEKIIPLLQEENKLVSDYQSLMASAKIEYKGETLNLSQIGKYMSDKDRDVRIESAKLYYQFLADHDEEFGTIYDKLVKLRDQMAKELGFKNYIELGYLRLGRVDYNAEMVKGYREQIKRDVVPVVYKLRKNQAKRLGYKNPIFLDFNVFFEDGNAKPAGNTAYLVECASKMYHDMGAESGEFFDYMVENHLMDLDARAGKTGGGYMTFIPKYKAPFIFANSNGSSSDVDTLTHEVGHAFQGYLCRNIKVPSYQMPTLEACEIDSMSMEFFAYPWMELFFKEGADKYRFAHLDGAISFLPYGSEVDEFQHFVYENPQLSHEERCAKWAELEKIYRPWMNFEGFDYLEKGKMRIRQSHIFTTPFYYIDYTLAQVLSLQFKCEMDRNRERAWKKYIKLLKMGGKYPFLTLVERDHLRNPFIDGNVIKVIKPQIKILNEFEKKFEYK